MQSLERFTPGHVQDVHDFALVPPSETFAPSQLHHILDRARYYRGYYTMMLLEFNARRITKSGDGTSHQDFTQLSQTQINIFNFGVEAAANIIEDSIKHETFKQGALRRFARTQSEEPVTAQQIQVFVQQAKDVAFSQLSS